jgi:hypothetical protein
MKHAERDSGPAKVDPSERIPSEHEMRAIADEADRLAAWLEDAKRGPVCGWEAVLTLGRAIRSRQWTRASADRHGLPADHSEQEHPPDVRGWPHAARVQEALVRIHESARHVEVCLHPESRGDIALTDSGEKVPPRVLRGAARVLREALAAPRHPPTQETKTPGATGGDKTVK